MCPITTGHPLKLLRECKIQILIILCSIHSRLHDKCTNYSMWRWVSNYKDSPSIRGGRDFKKAHILQKKKPTLDVFKLTDEKHESKWFPYILFVPWYWSLEKLKCQCIRMLNASLIRVWETSNQNWIPFIKCSKVNTRHLQWIALRSLTWQCLNTNSLSQTRCRTFKRIRV